MNVLLAPDKFKGNLDSFALCNAMKEGVLLAEPDATVTMLPMADGGDGFATVLAHYLNMTAIPCSTTDTLDRPIDSTFEWNEISRTAIIEMAAASGLALLQPAERNPLVTSTSGTGTIIKTALEKKAHTIILGLGGSATNDGGIGILHALGYRFYNAAHNELLPCGGSLQHIVSITKPAEPVTAEIIIACDVTNPLTGPNGCAHTYAAQKGVDAKQIHLLEKGMLHFAALIEKELGRSITKIPGLGAAGGTSAGLLLLPNVKLEKGIDIVFQDSNFHQQLANADLVITAEGAFDAQTLNGKVVYAVAQAAKAAGKLVMALCGKLDADQAIFDTCGLNYISSICDGPMSLEESMANAYELTTAATIKLVGLTIELNDKLESFPTRKDFYS